MAAKLSGPILKSAAPLQFVFEKEACLESTDLGNNTDSSYHRTFEGLLYFGLSVYLHYLPQDGGRGRGGRLVTESLR